MAYEQKSMARQKLLYNNSNDDRDLIYQLVVDGAKVEPDSATIAIFKPGATSATVAAAAVSPGISDSLIRHTVDTTTTADFPNQKGFRADYVITYGSETYNRHIMFDVVKYFLDLAISFDRLVAMDGSLRGQHSDGDETFSNIIEAVADTIRLDIETNLLEGETMLDSYVMDESRVAIPGLFAVLAQIYENKKEYEAADRNRGRYKNLLKKVMSTTPFDKDQDGFEDATPGGITPIVLVK